MPDLRPEGALLTFLQQVSSSQGLVQGHSGPNHSHLVVLALQDHLGRTTGPVRLRDQGPGADPGSGLALGSHRAVSGTDLGLLDLEVLVVVIDNGVFRAAGPDETDALEQNTRTKNDGTWDARAALEGRFFLERPPLLTCPLPPRCPHAGSHPPLQQGKGESCPLERAPLQTLPE